MSAYGIRMLNGDGSSGQWLTFYDPDGGDQTLAYPTGDSKWSEQPARALRFDSIGDAVTYWRQQSTRTPFRPDGKPNRPLSALTISIEPLP
jgi:hypothetical protein